MKAGHICTCKSFVPGKLECNVNKRGGEIVKELTRKDANRALNRSRHSADPPGYVYGIVETDFPLN